MEPMEHIAVRMRYSDLKTHDFNRSRNAGVYVNEEIQLTSNPYLLIGGDCGPVHGPSQGFPIESYTELVRPVLERADARFVNCMRAYSNRGVISENSPCTSSGPCCPATPVFSCMAARLEPYSREERCAAMSAATTRSAVLRSGGEAGR